MTSRWRDRGPGHASYQHDDVNALVTHFGMDVTDWQP